MRFCFLKPGLMLWVVGYVLSLPRWAMACSVCFGAADEPQTKGMNMAIVTLLIIVCGVLASFAAFFIHLWRQSRLHHMPTMDFVNQTDLRLRSEDTNR